MRLIILLMSLSLSACGAPVIATVSAFAGIATAISGLDETLIDGYLAMKGRPVGACTK